MGELKSVTVYDEVSDIYKDLRFGTLLRKSRGMPDGVGTSLGGNSSGDEEEINKLYNEIDMQEKFMGGQYETVLSNSEQFCFGHDHDDGDDEDGDYKMFIENIKVDRDGSYSYEISTSSGNAVIARFEGKEEGSSENVDSLKAKVPENSGRFMGKRKIEMPKAVKKYAYNGAEGCKNKVRDVPSEVRKSLLDENVDRLNGKVSENSGGFLGKRKIEMPKTMEKFADIGTEGCKNKVRDVPSEERKSLVNENVDRLNSKVSEDSGGFLGKRKKEMPKTVEKSADIGTEGCKHKVRDVPSEERKSIVDENVVKEKGDFSLACKSSREPFKEMDCDIIDESWAWYLNSLDNSGNSMELSYENDQTSIHSKNEEDCSDLEILEVDNIPSSRKGDYTPFVSSKCYQPLPGEENWDGIITSSQSQFRDKLMDLIKIPFDREEYENLLREVTYRKPVMGDRRLRSGRIISYPTGVLGKSYLDWYEGLRMKTDEFRLNQRKILYLLRGFFFWLENAAHEGAFHPWLDSSYLDALGE